MQKRTAIRQTIISGGGHLYGVLVFFRGGGGGGGRGYEIYRGFKLTVFRNSQNRFSQKQLTSAAKHFHFHTLLKYFFYQED